MKLLRAHVLQHSYECSGLNDTILDNVRFGWADFGLRVGIGLRRVASLRAFVDR